MSRAQSEVASALDLSIIRYSHVWEDHRVLARGLDVHSSDVVLCITRQAMLHPITHALKQSAIVALSFAIQIIYYK